MSRVNTAPATAHPHARSHVDIEKGKQHDADIAVSCASIAACKTRASETSRGCGANAMENKELLLFVFCKMPVNESAVCSSVGNFY